MPRGRLGISLAEPLPRLLILMRLFCAPEPPLSEAEGISAFRSDKEGYTPNCYSPITNLARALHLLQPLPQHFLLPQVLGHGESAFNLLTRLVQPAHLRQQIPANAVQQMIASQCRFSGRCSDVIHRFESGRR